jgi:hypothetical protein
MAGFVMPTQVTSLPQDQQEAIRKVLVQAGLLTPSGEPTTLTVDNIPTKNRAALEANLEAMGVDKNIHAFGINFKCIAARAAEVAAVAACALVPGGQLAIAACIAAAHALADEACK